MPRHILPLSLALVLSLPLAAPLTARDSSEGSPSFADMAAVSRPVETPPLSTDPPDPVDFEIALTSPPDATGLFRGSVLVCSRLADTPVKLLLNPTEGIEVLQAPSKLAGRIRRDVPFTFDIVARIAPTAPRPAGLNVKLRLRYPAAAALAVYRTGLSDSDAGRLPLSRRTLAELEGWAAGDGGGPVVSLDRSFFFPEVLR